MSTTLHRRRLAITLALAAAIAIAPASLLAAQAWQPTGNVEFVVPAPAGGSLDNTARTIQRIWTEGKLVPTTSVIVNRGGGGHAIAYNFLKQKTGDPHFLSITSPTLLTNHITGRLAMTYTDFSMLGVMLTEYIAFAVRPDSPIRNGSDLLKTLAENPAALSIALGNALGSTTHIALGLPLQSAGVDVKRLKLVSYNSSNEAVTALLGGHVDLAVGSTVNIGAQVQAGRLRAIATTAPRRLTGVYAEIPTWAELGHKGVFENWRGVMGPKGLTQEQIAFWESVLAEVVRSDEFKKVAAKNQWVLDFRGSAEMNRFLDGQYADLKAVMAYLGIQGKKKK